MVRLREKDREMEGSIDTKWFDLPFYVTLFYMAPHLNLFISFFNQIHCINDLILPNFIDEKTASGDHELNLYKSWSIMVITWGNQMIYFRLIFCVTSVKKTMCTQLKLNCHLEWIKERERKTKGENEEIRKKRERGEDKEK